MLGVQVPPGLPFFCKWGNEMKIVEWLKSVPSFIKDVRMEIKRTSFPSKEEVIDTTLVVIVVCIIFGIFLWLVDQAIFSLIQFVLQKIS